MKMQNMILLKTLTFLTIFFAAASALSCPVCIDDTGDADQLSEGKVDKQTQLDVSFKYSFVMRDLLGGELVQEGFDTSRSFELKSAKYKCDVTVRPSKKGSPSGGFDVVCVSPSQEITKFQVDCNAFPPQNSATMSGKRGVARVLMVGNCLE